MEYEQDDKTNEGGSLLERIKESPRTVSALIIILIVAAAIYAFSGEQPGQQPEGVPEETATEEAEATEQPKEVTPSEETAAPEQQVAAPTATPQVVEREQLQQQSRELPEAKKTQEGYMEIAEAGNGITHLARKATTRYLSENRVAYAVTNEHRIYIEDFIKDQIGSRPLSLGEELTVSFDLIKQAVDSAEQLNEQQLQNLTKYSSVLAT